MVVTDKFTKMVCLIPGQKTWKAPQWARCLFESIWGLPTVIISDRDGRSTSKFWPAILAVFNTRSHLTTAYHPQADGQFERNVQTVTIALRYFVDENQQYLVDILPFGEHASNSAVNASTGKTPFEPLFGFNPRHAADLHAKFALTGDL